MVKVPFQLMSHEPMMVGCCNLELLLRSFSDCINTGSPKIYKQHSCLGTTEPSPHVATFLTKWQIDSSLGYNIGHNQDIPLAGNKFPINFASLGNCIRSTAQVSQSRSMLWARGKDVIWKTGDPKRSLSYDNLICRLRCQNKQIQALLHLHCILMALQQSL